MATFLPFFSYSLEGYMKAKRYLLTKDIDVSQLRGFQLVEVANDIKETEAEQA